MVIQSIYKTKKFFCARQFFHRVNTLFVVVLMLMFLSTEIASAKTNTLDPMEDRYAQEVRDAFSQCRQEQNPVTQYLCSCRVLEQQCEGARRLEHGDWNTVEFWPSDDEAEREVQFILSMDYDILGEFAPLDTGLVMSCMKGKSEINVFIGEGIDSTIPPQLAIDDTNFKSHFSEGSGNALVSFEDVRKAFDGLIQGQTLWVTYFDFEGEQHEAEFELYGFEHVSEGWKALCFSPES